MSSNATSSSRRSRISGLKDEVLFALGEDYNTAQFASFSPQLTPRFSRLSGYAPNHFPGGPEETAAALLSLSGEASVNVRSFLPDNPQTTDFAYGLKSVGEIADVLRRFSAKGLYTILNETIDIHDGGVSGVVSGDLVEFAPDDTPRCVEKPGTVSLSRAMARHILGTVYPFSPPFGEDQDVRLEFSLHPLRRGHRQEHVIVWEASHEDPSGMTARPAWPNRFSPLVGDKVFGLLVADACGLPVPRATVISRRIAPFTFGLETGCAERWLRTAPAVQMPGKFTTSRGWQDPYLLMAKEDEAGQAIASIVSQDGVAFEWSGACVSGPDGLVIEGCRGDGERFMTGEVLPDMLPDNVVERVRALYAQAEKALGPVRFEWVDDGETVWLVQLHLGATGTSIDVIVQGEADVWHEFQVTDGLEALRSFVAAIGGLDDGRRHGISVKGRFGRTSHLADVLRKAGHPARAA